MMSFDVPPYKRSPITSKESDNQQRLIFDEGSQDHLFTFTCHKKSSSSHQVRDGNPPGGSGIGSNQYKTKPLPPIDMNELTINKKEIQFKTLLLDELHRKMCIDRINDPLSLSEKIKLPVKETQALCKADLKKVSSYMLMQSITQFGYDIHVCMRPTLEYKPGEIIFES